MQVRCAIFAIRIVQGPFGIFLVLPRVELHEASTLIQLVENSQQEGRLAPAYFSQEYKYFDQHLPTVKNEITV